MAQGPRDFTDPNYFYTDKLRFMENSVLSFLQILFATFPPGCMHYEHEQTDANITEIHIEGQGTDNLQVVDNRPKIVVARGPVQFQQAGMNAMIGSANTSLLSQRHATIMAGSVGISCYSREELEADKIAEICASAIEAFQPIIRKYGFLEIRTAQIGQRAMIKSDSRPELYVTPVLLRTSVTANWNRSVIDPVKLRKYILEFKIAPPIDLTVSTTVKNI
jgi:hypothetical protein